VHGYAVHLTVRSIYSVDPVGQIDFGGTEYVPAGKIAIESYRRRPEDRYEWWDLGRDTYFVEFNETLELAEDEIALLEPEERLVRAGATHVPMLYRGRVAPIETLLHVEALRLEIKRNARISRVWVFKMAASGAGSSAAKGVAGKRRKATKK
jgi:deoxycytidine triphosphate deaminase